MKLYQILINQGIDWKMEVLKRIIMSVFARK